MRWTERPLQQRLLEGTAWTRHLSRLPRRRHDSSVASLLRCRCSLPTQTRHSCCLPLRLRQWDSRNLETGESLKDRGAVVKKLVHRKSSSTAACLPSRLIYRNMTHLGLRLSCCRVVPAFVSEIFLRNARVLGPPTRAILTQKRKSNETALRPSRQSITPQTWERREEMELGSWQ